MPNFLAPLRLNRLELINALAMNVAVEPSPATAGLLIYNTATSKFGVGNGSTFDYMGAGTGGISQSDVYAILQSASTGTESGISVDWDDTAKKWNFTVVSGAAAATPSLRALGTTSTTAAAGNDSRLSDTRTPTDGTVTNAKVASSAAITLDTLAETTTLKLLTATERTKLSGVATGATANSTDAVLLARANHTGTQTASTISDLDNFVSTKINALVAGAPGLLDTLDELAAALGDDPNFAATVTSQLALKANNADLAAVAKSGSYNDLLNKPTNTYTTAIPGTGTTQTITHNLGTRAVTVQFYTAADPYEAVDIDFRRTTANSITVLFAVAPVANAYIVVVQA